MKFFLFLFFLFFLAPALIAQNFSGQWRGSFKENANPGAEVYSANYVLTLKENGNRITGTSYTSYIENGKKFYSLCTVIGSIDPKRKWIRVTENKRTKTNETSNAGLQTHLLYYKTEGSSEMLSGKWQVGTDKNTSSSGTTNLSRKAQAGTIPQMAALAKIEKEKQRQKDLVKTASAKQPTTIKSTEEPIIIEMPQAPVISYYEHNIKKIAEPDEIPEKLKKNITESLLKRKKLLTQTIYTQSDNIKIELYDNGEIDGDSISLFYNQEIILSHAMLTTRPITIMINIASGNQQENELIMYAENLGTIPPNTALMVITDGSRRYEIRITSDLQKSGSVRFIRQLPPN